MDTKAFYYFQAVYEETQHSYGRQKALYLSAGAGEKY